MSKFDISATECTAIEQVMQGQTKVDQLQFGCGSVLMKLNGIYWNRMNVVIL